MELRRILFVMAAIFVANVNFAQYTPPDEGALESVIVEKYYVSDAADACDEDGGSLAEGSVTYRVFLDLKEDYVLQTVYGNDHALSIATTTEFFNNEDRGERFGFEIGDNNLGDNTVALDSYLTFGAASEAHYGMPKDLDTDGSVIGGVNNDGGSCSATDGLLINDDPTACDALTDIDGLVAGAPPTITFIGDADATADLSSLFADVNGAGTFVTNNGAWAVLGGATGPTPENIIMIGQFTTDGDFSFELNIRIGIPEDVQCDDPACHTFIDYYATILPADTTGGVETENQFESAFLSFNSATDPVGCVADGIEENQTLLDNFTITPNPAEEEAFLNFSGIAGGLVSYELIDIQGRVIQSKSLGAFTGERREIVNLQRLESGAYMVRLIVGDAYATKQLIKY